MKVYLWCHTMAGNARGLVPAGVLGNNRFVVRFHNVLEGFKAATALRRLPIGTSGVNIGHAGLSIALFKMFLDFLVAKRVAKTNDHGKNSPFLGSDSLCY
jgi:hypothetical protein